MSLFADSLEVVVTARSGLPITKGKVKPESVQLVAEALEAFAVENNIKLALNKSAIQGSGVAADGSRVLPYAVKAFGKTKGSANIWSSGTITLIGALADFRHDAIQVVE